MSIHAFHGLTACSAPWNDLRKIQQEPDSCVSESNTMAYKADLENFVVLVKQMLQLDLTQRITPSQVLQHPFITMSHLKDFCCSQSLSSDQGEAEATQQPLSENQVSRRFSCGAQSTQNLLSLSEEDISCKAHIKPIEKRKRANAITLKKRNRSRGSTSK